MIPMNLLADNTFRIVTEERGNPEKIPSSKHYIVYPETIQWGNDLDIESDGRRVRGGVLIDKLCLAVSHPLIQINCITNRIQ